MMMVPAGARTGKVKIVSGTGASAETTLSATALTVMDPAEVTAINPASALRGSKVTIVGKGFLNLSPLVVQFNNGQGSTNQSATILGKTDTSIDVTVPGGASSGRFSVQVGTGMTFEIVTTTMDFTALPTPLSLDSFTPAFGAVGTTVTLTGYGHVNPIVMFTNNVRATSSAAAKTMTAKGMMSATAVTVPAGAVTGPITLLTAEGSVANHDVFTIPTFKTALTGFQPDAGTVGTVLTLQGTFNPVAANNVVTFR
jgi:hypothetical protein